MADPSNQILDIVAQAAQIANPEVRRTFLDDACQGNPTLRASVERLLTSQNEHQTTVNNPLMSAEKGYVTEYTLDQPSGQTTEAPSYAAGTLLANRFRLVERLEKGGMGEVWLAEQLEPIKRQVALKLILSGRHSEAITRSFELERQTLAIMDHPNIARIFDGGVTEEQEPFFVMELVRGLPLTDYCDIRQLTIRERVELLISVCRAVQHAHQKGIIHRDLKPKNILVTEFDRGAIVKVIDFGVAKVTSQQLNDLKQNELGGVVGTPAYMSPEQADPERNPNKIDTRSDIYSLGTILYQLLVGTPPYNANAHANLTLFQILNRVREEPIPTLEARFGESGNTQLVAHARKTVPSLLLRELRGDLQSILDKCLQKNPNDRYETVSDLAADLSRYLKGESVLAHAQTTRYRVGKFLRRNKGVVIAATVVAIVFAVGLIGTTLGLFEARKQAGIAQKETKQKELALIAEAQRAEGERQAKLEAEKNLQQAQKNLALAKKGTEVLASVFGGLDPRLNIETLAELRKAMAENLSKAVEQLDEFTSEDPIGAANLQTILGTSLDSLGRYEQAIPLFQKAYETRKKHLGEEADLTLKSLEQLGSCLHVNKQHTEAEPLLRKVLDISKRKYGEDHEFTLVCMHSLASFLIDTGDSKNAIPLFVETLRRRREKFGTNNEFTLETMSYLAASYTAINEYEKALGLNLEILKTHRENPKARRQDLLAAVNNTSFVYIRLKQFDKALPMLENSMKEVVTRLGRDHPTTTATMHNLARSYQGVGQHEKAITLSEQIIEKQKERFGPDHIDTLRATHEYTLILFGADQKSKAIALHEELLEARKTKLGAEHADTFLSMATLASLYEKQNEIEKAIPYAEKALEGYFKMQGKFYLKTARASEQMGSLCRAQKQYPKAIPFYQDAIDAFRDRFGDDHPDVIRMTQELALTYEQNNEPEKALKLLEANLNIVRSKFGSENDETLNTLGLLGKMSATAKRGDDCAKYYREVIKHEQKKKQKEPVAFARLQVSFAVQLLRCEQCPVAEEFLRESLEVLGNGYSKDWFTFHTQSVLGEALVRQKKYNDAEKLLLGGFEGMTNGESIIPMISRPCLLESLDRLIDFYTLTKKPDEVMKYQKLRKEWEERLKTDPKPKK